MQSILKKQEYINQAGQILTFKDVDDDARTLRFTLSDGSITSIPFGNTDKLFNISISLSGFMEQYIINQLLP